MSFADEVNKKAAEVYQNAREKGWYDEPRTALEVHMLVVSELAEATEEVRKGTPDRYYNHDDRFKPEGEAVELADAIIRILDYAGSKGWDLGDIIEDKIAYNKTRPYKHGKKC